MKKYIDADKLIEEIGYIIQAAEANYEASRSQGLHDAIDEINAQPEAVVRCKYCKWRVITVVGLACDRGLMPRQTEDDDFCSWGEFR